jgi:hypothetical protein
MRHQFDNDAYPLSGGFKPWSLISKGMVAPLLKAEDAMMPLLGGLLAFPDFRGARARRLRQTAA